MAETVPAATDALLGIVALPGWLPPAALSPNARVHWRTRARVTRDVRATIWGAVLHAGWPRQRQTLGMPRRRLVITVRRKRLMDPDNLTANCKAIVDGVRETGALEDDSPRYLDLVVQQEKGEPCTRLDLYEIREATP